MRYQSFHKRHQIKATRLHMIVSLAVFPFVFGTIFSVEFPSQGKPAPESST